MNTLFFMSRVYFTCIVLVWCTGTVLVAQSGVIEEPGIAKLLNTYISNNVSETQVNAWRIQIVTTSDRRRMEAAISRFRVLYPDMEHSWQHNSPYYQVRVGTFETREDLEALLLEIKKEFPTAIPVQESIVKTDIIKP